ncbi:MAG TPA: galactokinase [Gemmatimonadetes bacterium]|nr:galactokinase [Gemmatimonadota bacterium]
MGFEPRAVFAEEHGLESTHLARAPGRVNLIGEHTDYNGLPVFPMAIQREAHLAFRSRDDGFVRIRSIREDFEEVEFEIVPGIAASPAGHWGNYLKAPADELARQFAISRGFDGVLASDIPIAAGLSSSSALVNAVGLALAHVNGIILERLPFAEVMAEAERYTGTRGGGMDQAISMAGHADHAARIEFSPLQMRHVPVPQGWCFVIANTGVRAEKSGHAGAVYNARRKECEEAFRIVADVALNRGLIHSRLTGYRNLLQILEEDIVIEVGEAALRGTLLQRFRHVITEAARVEAAVDLMISDDLQGFGWLMDDSHRSLRVDYEVSSKELDELVMVARDAGAEGARLTGAGLGGCIVTLAEQGKVDAVLEGLSEGYYAPRGITTGIDQDLFMATPSVGASVITL